MRFTTSSAEPVSWARGLTERESRNLEILDPRTQLPAYLTHWIRALAVWVRTPEIRKALASEKLLADIEVAQAFIEATPSDKLTDDHKLRQAVEDCVKGCMRQAVSSRKVRRVIAKHLGRLPGNDPKTVLEELGEIKAALEP